jgi:hypothetical protein
VRNPDVKYGSNPSLIYTIPNRKQFYYASVPTWNGNEQGMDIYTIPQPVPVDVKYSVKIVCNRMRELNELNKVVMQKFSSRQAYTFIKGQYVPIIMDNISNESQLTIGERKYYIQSYDFTMLGYLIDEDEFEVKPAIARVTQLMEIDNSTRKQRRKKYPPNPDEVDMNYLFVSGNTSLTDVMDYTANMNFVSSDNVDSYEVYINYDFYGIDNSNIQITTNDVLTINITKVDDTQDANILFENTLYGSSPVNRGVVSYSDNTYTLGTLSGATFQIATQLGFQEGSKIKLVHDSQNYQYSTVVSYAPKTGTLIFSGASDVHVFPITGSGTYNTWNIF